MVRVSRKQIHAHLQQGDTAATKNEKGKALEGLICYLFETIPGITLKECNSMNTFESEEIDIVFWNDYDPQGLPSPAFPYVIFVECKNWSKKVSSSEVSWFDKKLQDRALTFGVLVAAHGITGEPEDLTRAHYIVSTALRERRRIIVITREDIENITDSIQLVKLFKKRLCELIVHQTCLS